MGEAKPGMNTLEVLPIPACSCVFWGKQYISAVSGSWESGPEQSLCATCTHRDEEPFNSTWSERWVPAWGVLLSWRPERL